MNLRKKKEKYYELIKEIKRCYLMEQNYLNQQVKIILIQKDCYIRLMYYGVRYEVPFFQSSVEKVVPIVVTIIADIDKTIVCLTLHICD